MTERLLTRRATLQSRLAVRFILSAAGVYATAAALAYLLIALIPPVPRVAEVTMPPVFWLTTLLLAAGSACLARARLYVSLEKQRPFRRSLLGALVAGVLFVGIQCYGLSCLIRNQIPGEVQTGANAFVTMIAALHAMHFTLALLLLVWVTINALADRYDHEYHFGVTLCAWFWHGLGVVWILILFVFLIVTSQTGWGSAPMRNEAIHSSFSVRVTSIARLTSAARSSKVDAAWARRMMAPRISAMRSDRAAMRS